uniref:7TM GPCR serpentine receptor class x (Srx) domain-containing protein n=1 Tax=Panagrolaimus davidi TaxID=227884 RepID=A0A914PN40_9BILA
MGTFKPAIYLLISSFCTSMIVFKLAKQAKFQLKHNPRDFFNSARITIVIVSQTTINFLVFSVFFINSFLTIVGLFYSPLVPIPVITTKLYVDGKNYTGYIDFRFPLWVDGRFGLTSTVGQQALSQTRILIESLITLFVMTGYREAIVKIFQKIYLLIRNPRKFIGSFKRTSPQTSWT